LGVGDGGGFLDADGDGQDAGGVVFDDLLGEVLGQGFDEGIVPAGGQLLGAAGELATAARLGTTGLLRSSTALTTVKQRVLAGAQQLLRIDFENSPAHEVLRAKLAEFERQLPNCDAVILSDYGKGGLTHIPRMIELARAVPAATAVESA